MKKLLTSLLLTTLVHADTPKFPTFSIFDGDADGWVSSSTAFQHFPRAGNPDGCIGLEDEGSDGNWAVAPTKFLGDWSSLDENGALFFDHKVYDPGTGNPLINGDYIVRIHGDAGALATWTAPGPAGATQWKSFRLPIRESKWVLETGTNWDELLRNITKLEIKMEMFNNSGGTTHDKDAIDNVALVANVNNCELLDIKMKPVVAFVSNLNKTYVIETSSDNENFKTLATIPGTGNLISYTDNRPLKARQFYRIICQN